MMTMQRVFIWHYSLLCNYFIDVMRLVWRIAAWNRLVNPWNGQEMHAHLHDAWSQYPY